MKFNFALKIPMANILLGAKMYDMTTCYKGFHANIAEKFMNYHLLSKTHFYQTELRYLLRKSRFAEKSIHYRVPSPSVSKKAILNAFSVLFHCFFLRLIFTYPTIK